jgi:RNA polymerase sigma-70 factor (ECF subfamily)
MNVEDLYRRYGPMVMRRCRQLLRDEDQALDATQDVFVRLMERSDRLRDDYPSSLIEPQGGYQEEWEDDLFF